MKRLLMHFPIGTISAFLTAIHWPMGAVSVFAFYGYEYIQEWRKVDHSYKDVIGFLIGYYCGAIFAVVWKYGLR